MVRKVFLLVLPMFFLTPHSWGFSFEQTEKYKKEARELNLDHTDQWLRLGHYHKSLFGTYKSKIQGSFFISDRGSKDPKAELEKTIEYLFSSEEQAQLQCRYLARTRWLKEKLHIDDEDLVKCPGQDAWKKKLHARDVFLIFASSDLSSAASSFGHTFLRLHNPENTQGLDLIDYGVNFAAQANDSDGAMFALKGLFGMYSGYYSMMPFHQKLREYTNLEGRDIWEYKINLNSGEVERLVDHLLELEGSSVSYYFLDDNCSYQILELLEVARPSLSLTSHFYDVTIPIDTLKVIASQGNLLSDERLRPSLQSEFQSEYRQLDLQEKNQLTELVQVIQANEKPEKILFERMGQEKTPTEGAKAKILDSALAYLAIKEYREQKNYKNWKYQLAVERASLGSVSEKKSVLKEPPLISAASAEFYLGAGRQDDRDLLQIKIRRAFHDLISRDEGVSPFTHMEVLSATASYEPTPKRWELEQLQLLKIISTNPVTQLDSPISWKLSFGTEPQFNPFFEGGIGYSFDFDWGKESRWINLFSSRAFHQDSADFLGLGFESIFIQKVTEKIRLLESLQYLGVIQGVPYTVASLAASMDLSRSIEARFSFEKKQDQNTWLFSLIL